MTYSILVVEDEDDVRELVATSLRHRGFSVLSVPNAEVALQILMEQVKFDLLFTDIVMPGADGFDLAAQAKLIRPSLKVLYSTGFADRAQGRFGPRYGRLLEKPIRADALIAAIEKALGGDC
jgi:CheY-like chemotaxis protein